MATGACGRIARIVATLACGALNSAAIAQLTLITGATIVDPVAEQPEYPAEILIDGSRIAAVAPQGSLEVPVDTERIDAAGKFVIPGLIDAHNHLGSGAPTLRPGEEPTALQILAALPKWGITSVFDPRIDLPTYRALKALDDSSGAHARFFSAGQPFSIAGGWQGEGSFTPTTVDEVHAAIRELVAADVDGVKVYYDDMRVFGRQLPVFDLTMLEAVASEAHAHSLRVFVHAPDLGYAKSALRAGADALMHGIADEPVDDELLSLLRERRAVYVPTQVLYEARGASPHAWAEKLNAFDERGLLDTTIRDAFFTLPDRANPVVSRYLPIARSNLERIAAAGIPIAMGTDTGIGGIVAGIASQLEITLYAELGLTELEALRAATSTAATVIGRADELGSVSPGKLADLVLLDADPLVDIGNIRKISAVMIGGVVVYEASR